MSDTFEQYKEQAKLFINNSDWLTDECNKIVCEFKSVDYNCTDREYLEDLMARMTYLQGKINVERCIYKDFVKNNEEYME